MVDVILSKKASEKYNYLVNGIRKSINLFFDGLENNTFSEKDLILIFEDKDGKLKVYSYKCEKLYVTLTREAKNWFIFDLLTEEEYKDLEISVN